MRATAWIVVVFLAGLIYLAAQVASWAVRVSDATMP